MITIDRETIMKRFSVHSPLVENERLVFWNGQSDRNVVEMLKMKVDVVRLR